MLVDTHAHLDFPEYKSDLPEVITRAAEANVGYIIDVGTSLKSSREAIELARQFDNIYASIGIHPHEASHVSDNVWSEFETLVSQSKVVAIGETGLDYYRNRSPHEEQQHLFCRHLELSKKASLPVIIHNREATNDCLKTLREHANNSLRGVVHCFSGSEESARDFMELGLNISFAGPVTFSNADKLRKVVQSVPVERLLLETDCPFLSPQPKRGKRNEPANLTYIIPVFAELYKLSTTDVARITTLNAKRLFNIGEIEQEGKVAYVIRNSLYLNITNRCSNECIFCARLSDPWVKGHYLKLTREPTAEGVIKAIGDPTPYDEVVFCGYGEATERLDVLKTVARFLKEKGVRVRLDTNGHGDLINGRPICGELHGLIDTICISLNTTYADEYERLCHPKFGEKAYTSLISFIKEAKQTIPDVVVSIVGYPGVNVERCKQLADELGVNFRLRRYDEVG
ncbi:MAG: TatD family hydrolase [Candidatus Brocadiales bacterium]